ncbi:MAG: DUF2079 domain-containing protein [Candidatus Omnitrophica bacterium]|nr:DUF2079 domain-containing protein [Candidatus Omnitrophota bacterium]
MERIDKFCQKISGHLLWASILSYILVFGYLCFLKYHSFNYLDWDLASDVIVLRNSVSGRFLYYPFLEQIIFGAHLYLIIFLILPLYALFQSPLTLLFLQSIFLGLAAWPLYLLARRRLNQTFSLAVAVAYLLYPSVGYMNLFETHFDIYEIFFLFFALYYFEKENFRRFIVFVILAISCKENASLAVAMLGIYALIRRRSKQWVLIPLLIGASWFLLSVKVIIPHFAKDAQFYQEGFIFSHYYKHLGGNLFEMAKTLILHPVSTAVFAFSPPKIIYIFQLFVPTGFLGLLSPLALLPATPVFMQNLLSSSPNHSLIYYQYTALLIPFIFFSVVCSFAKLLRYKLFIRHQGALLSCFFGFVIFSGIYLGAPQFNIIKRAHSYRLDDLSRQKEGLVRMVPQNSPVIATFQFLPKLTNRQELYSLHLIAMGYKMYTKIRYEAPKDLEYALIDFNEPLMLNAFFPPLAAGNIRAFLEAGDWRVFTAFDDTVLFRKGYGQGYRLCEEVANPKIAHPLNLILENGIIFLGYDVVDDKISDRRLLHLVYYWKKTKGGKSPQEFLIRFSGLSGNAGFVKGHVFGYRVYLRDEWRAGRIMKEHHYILLPPGTEKNNYRIDFGPFVN